MEVRPEDDLESGEIVSEPVQIPKVKLSPERFNTQNLQDELRKNMVQIMEATDKEKVEDSMDTIKKLVEEIPYLQIPKEEPLPQDTIEMPHIETDAEIDNSLKSNFKELLAEDYDGQISMYVPDKGATEPQVTGQMSIDEVLADWEKTKRAAETALEEAKQRKLESAKARALQEAGDIMERLVDVIPKLDSGLTPKDLLDEEYLGGQPIADDKAAEMVANMNQILQQEIDRLSSENARMDEQLAAASAAEAAGVAEPQEALQPEEADFWGNGITELTQSPYEIEPDAEQLAAEAAYEPQTDAVYGAETEPVYAPEAEAVYEPQTGAVYEPQTDAVVSEAEQADAAGSYGGTAEPEIPGSYTEETDPDTFTLGAASGRGSGGKRHGAATGGGRTGGYRRCCRDGRAGYGSTGSRHPGIDGRAEDTAGGRGTSEGGEVRRKAGRRGTPEERSFKSESGRRRASEDRGAGGGRTSGNYPAFQRAAGDFYIFCAD